MLKYNILESIYDISIEILNLLLYSEARKNYILITFRMNLF
jgi:hypothetical protein